MNKVQWIDARQQHSEVSWETILLSGYDAVPCSCGLEGCKGWKLEKVQKVHVPVSKSVALVHSPDAA